jgi:integrase
VRVRVRQRHYPDGSSVWTADLHVQPAGEPEVERFRITAPSTVTTKSGAERWAMERAKRIAVEGRPRNTKKARVAKAQLEAAERAAYVPTLGEFWPTFLEHLRAERRKPNTIDSYTRVGTRKLLPLFLGTRLTAITQIDVQRLKASMQTAAASYVNLALTVLAQVLKLAAAHHPAVVVPPLRRVRDTAGPHLRFYDRDQAAALVRATEGQPERLAAILLALDAGLRRNEVHALRWHDVDLVAGELTVRHSLCRGQLLTPKSGKPRRVPLTRRLAGVLADLGRSSEWILPRSTQTKVGSLRENAPVDLGAVLTSAAKLAGVPDLKSHALRHTFACHALAAGADLQAVSKLLGHSNVAVTAASYCHLLPGADRQAVSKLEAFATAPSPATVTDLAHARARLRGEQGERL